MKKILGFIIMTAMLVSMIPVFAEETSDESRDTIKCVQSGANEVTLTGSFGISAKDAEVAIQIYCLNKSSADIEEGSDQIDVLIYQEQTKADRNGNFKFEIIFPEGAITNYYSGKIICQKPYEVVDIDDILYKNADDIKTASRLLKQYADAENYSLFEDTVDTYSFSLGIGETIKDVTVDRAKVKGVLYEYYKNNEVDPDNSQLCMTIVQTAEVLCAVNDKQIDDIFLYSDKIGVKESRLNKFLTEAYVTEAFKKAVTSAFAGEHITDPADILEKLYETFVLEATYEPNGYTNIAGLLKEFSEELGVAESKITPGVCRNVAGTKYKNYKALGDAIIAAGESGGGASGGGGGGGGSSSGSKKETVSMPQLENIKIEELPVNIFDDIASVSWAEEAIVFLAQRGIIAGKGNNKFAPNDNITREEFVKILTLAFFEDAEPGAIDFADVPESAWFYQTVAKAYSAGIAEGIGNHLFGAGENISRQDAAVMACRAAEKAGLWVADEMESKETFFDDDSISDYAKDSVYILYGKGIVNGTGGSLFSPKAEMTRAEAAKIVYALFQV